jgi:ribosomal protein S18 acetylase RimI-like enzyme
VSVVRFDLPGAVPDAFLELPHAVYARAGDWIPEDADTVRQALSRDHDWFATGHAVGFVVPGRARLVAFDPPGLCIEGKRAMFFGYFEQVEGADSDSAALLADAERWAHSRGAELLIGPIDFNTSRRYRLRRTAEPGAATFLGEPYNPFFYENALTNAGYGVARRYLTQIGMQQPVRVAHKEQVRDAVIAAGYDIQPLDGAAWRANLAEIKPLTDAIFSHNFAFTPESFDTFARGYGEAVARRLCPRTSVIARGPDGALVGFALLYPDYSPLIAASAGADRVRAADLSFAEHAPLLDGLGHRTGVVRTIGVHPDHRSRGVMDALLAEAVARGVRFYDRWIGALIEESNLSRRFGASQTDHARSYVLVSKVIDAAGG